MNTDVKRRCLWCGEYQPQVLKNDKGFYVSCDTCGASGPAGTKEHCLEQWNKGPKVLSEAYRSKSITGLELIQVKAERDSWKARCKKLFDDNGETIMVMTTCSGEETSVTKESRVCNQVGCSSGLPPDVCDDCLDKISESFLKTLKLYSDQIKELKNKLAARKST